MSAMNAGRIYLKFKDVIEELQNKGEPDEEIREALLMVYAYHASITMKIPLAKTRSDLEALFRDPKD